MGISGLLPLLKEITVPSHIREWKGKTLAVDAYVWLHRGAYGCAEELATGKPTIKYVNYSMHRVRMLKYYGVTPFIVFDGGLLPSKMGTEGDREKRRTAALAKGNAFLAEGKSTHARECFVKAVDVTPAMAYQLIKALRQEGIRYVVAPYEADPQLAYLEKRGLVDGIITEDSDLLVFGCRNVLFKLDGEGNCSSISRDDFSKCREFNFSDWSDVEFRQMAILSGCDYLESIVGLGLKTAYRLMRKYKTAEKVIQFVRLDGQLTVPRNYVDEFRRAELTFLHQRVFDPVDRKLVHFSPLPEGKTAEDMPFVGADLDPNYVCGLADGNIDPLSKEPIVDLMPNSCSTTTTHRTTYKPSPSTSTVARAKPKGGAPVPQPAKGAASLLSFFSRTPAPSTSTSATPINPVKNVANQKRVHLVSGAKENGAQAKVASPKRKSKFFGKVAMEERLSAKGEEKIVEIDEDVEIAMWEEEGLADEDEDAEIALREVEMEVSVVGSMEQSDEGEGSTSEAPPMAIDDASHELERATSPAQRLSSPVVTPRHSKAPPRSARLADQDDPVSDDAAAISSPASSAQADAGWEEPALSSPPASRPGLCARSPPVATSSIPRHAIKTEHAQVKTEKPAVTRTNVDIIELSSDPIDVASSDGLDHEAGQHDTPRPPPRVNAEAAKKSSQDKKTALTKQSKTPQATVHVRPDPSSTAKGKGKKRCAEPNEDGEAEVDTAVQSVAASWRAKFMLQNSSASRTPRAKTNAKSPNVPAPETSSRPPSTEKATKKPLSPRKSSLGQRGRVPLSPRSTNRTSSLQMSEVAAPELKLAEPRKIPPPKRRKLSSTTSSSPSSSNPGLLLDTDANTSTPPLELHKGSSSPTIITNPKLLAFRFQGSRTLA
ncbi:hypothetical protein JCM16303_007237 [Sporobolomyces ruberrimus]